MSTIAWIAPRGKHFANQSFLITLLSCSENSDEFDRTNFMCHNIERNNYFYISSIGIKNCSSKFEDRIWQVIAIIFSQKGE